MTQLLTQQLIYFKTLDDYQSESWKIILTIKLIRKGMLFLPSVHFIDCLDTLG